MENKKWYTLLFVLLGMVGVVFINRHKINVHKYICKRCRNLPKESIAVGNENIEVELYTVSKEHQNITYQTYGTIIGHCETPIMFEHGAHISFISSSREVAKGQVIIALDTSTEEWKKKSLVAHLENKKKKLVRMKKLFENHIASANDLEQLETEIIELESRIEELNIKISQMSMRAVEDGYFFLNNTASETGIMVQARQQLGYFFSKKKYIKYYVPQDLLKHMHDKETLKVIFFPDFNGAAPALEAQMEVSLENFRPLIANENEHKNSLCEGLALLKESNLPPYLLNQNGKVVITFNEEESYTLVPEIALLNRGIKTFVYVVQNQKAILTEIEIMEPAEGGYVKIKEKYLSPATTIVLRGINKIYHTATVYGATPLNKKQMQKN